MPLRIEFLGAAAVAVSCRAAPCQGASYGPRTIPKRVPAQQSAEFGRDISPLELQLSSFPPPEGILSCAGNNALTLATWAMQPGGACIAGLSLGAGAATAPGLTGLTGPRGRSALRRPGEPRGRRRCTLYLGVCSKPRTVPA